MYITARTTNVPVNEFKKFLEDEKCSEIIYNTEQPENVQLHNHWCFKINKDVAAFKKQRTRKLKEYKGNEFVSIQELKKSKDEYLQYMCKGYNVTKPYSKFVGNCEKPQVEGLELQEIEVHHEQFWKTYDAIKPDAENSKRTRTTGEKFLDYALPYCLDNKIEANNRKEIAKVTIRYFGKIAKTKFGKHLICEHMNLLTFNLDEAYMLGECWPSSNFMESVLDMDRNAIYKY